MPRGFTQCAQLGADVNPNGLDMNCYYCTVAALKNMNVRDLVKVTGIMQSNEGAQHDEITSLFTDAGFATEAYIMKGFSTAIAGQNDWCSATQMQAGLMSMLSFNEYCGLAYQRPDGSKHMIVAARTTAATFAINPIQCADFQTATNVRQIQNFPPENGTNYLYRAWLIDEMAELTNAFDGLNIS